MATPPTRKTPSPADAPVMTGQVRYGWCCGLSAFGASWHITLPLAAPGTATASLPAFVFSGNNFMFALVFADDSTQTVPVTLFNFISYAGTDWGGLMAATTLITLPVLVAAVLGQKHLIAGLASGATKG